MTHLAYAEVRQLDGGLRAHRPRGRHMSRKLRERRPTAHPVRINSTSWTCPGQSTLKGDGAAFRQGYVPMLARIICTPPQTPAPFQPFPSKSRFSQRPRPRTFNANLSPPFLLIRWGAGRGFRALPAWCCSPIQSNGDIPTFAATERPAPGCGTGQCHDRLLARVDHIPKAGEPRQPHRVRRAPQPGQELGQVLIHIDVELRPEESESNNNEHHHEDGYGLNDADH